MRGASASTIVAVHVGAPLPGCGDIAIVCPPTATHSAGEGHDTAVNASIPSTFALCQAVGPAVGLVVVMALPAASTAMQSVVVGQATPARAPVAMWAVCQAVGPAVGLVVVMALPAASTAMQSVVVGQATPARAPVAMWRSARRWGRRWGWWL